MSPMIGQRAHDLCRHLQEEEAEVDALARRAAADEDWSNLLAALLASEVRNPYSLPTDNLSTSN